MRFTASLLHDFAAATSREWLETDGRGGYAAATVIACPTRRYHGWLVAPVPDGGKRHVFLTRCDEWLRTEAGEHGFSCARWPDAIAPRGDRLQTAFELAPFPVWTYAIAGLTLRRELLLLRGRHAVLVRYSLTGVASTGVELCLRPLLACREADALTFANAALDATVQPLPDGVCVRPYAALPALALTWSAGSVAVEPGATWYRRVHYAADVARGFDGEEDNWSPCRLRLALREGAPVVLAASIDGPVPDPRGAFAAEAERRRTAFAGVATPRERVALAAGDFLFRAPGDRLAVCAGYPWFTEWGRDSFIALPGLTLALDRPDTCAEVLRGALPFLRRGLLPNVYGATPETCHYGSVDAALWFARAVCAWADAAEVGRARALAEFLPALAEIADRYADGTAGLGIGVTADGLLRAGAPDLNPTWMDARIASGPVTPRDGCAVELNALWYLLLVELAAAFRARDEQRARRYAAWAARAKQGFLARFWLPAGYLADRITSDDRIDASVRPNMVIAAALPQSPLAAKQRQGVVDKARRELLTPLGLRTLSPHDPAYVGRYQGGPAERDAAYHQGTVWPWLLGFYVEACLRAHAPSKQRCAELRALFAPLAAELDATGLQHVSEVFDGDPPHRPGGTFAQAWNTGEWLRALRLLDETERARA